MFRRIRRNGGLVIVAACLTYMHVVKDVKVMSSYDALVYPEASPVEAPECPEAPRVGSARKVSFAITVPDAVASIDCTTYSCGVAYVLCFNTPVIKYYEKVCSECLWYIYS